jgi:hypothetical protein
MKSRSTVGIALVLFAAAAACHDGGDDTSAVEGAQTQGEDGVWPASQMLQRPDERPARFVVRAGAFHPEDVGLDTKPSKEEGCEPFVFDTSRPGNSKAGHGYGTHMSDDERRSSLEHLKSP